jgi:hypothetical protein
VEARTLHTGPQRVCVCVRVAYIYVYVSLATYQVSLERSVQTQQPFILIFLANFHIQGLFQHTAC